ncbi:hypothetical protein KPK_B0034 (plasmid) [Klebsiella variicola]|uniref:Uncharacterized protein n=1 Tax=Klebsiella variicola (strain 342) TaxID=507522 RepID=B5RKJ3_KLEV3|nr:hypothetical protein KPK_B0034 [Klebsiella variicola]
MSFSNARGFTITIFATVPFIVPLSLPFIIIEERSENRKCRIQ